MKALLHLILPYFKGSEKNYARYMGLFLAVLSQSVVLIGYFFAQWNKRFYDALELKNIKLFMWESFIFLVLAICYIIIYALYRYYGQHYALKWRLWMTKQALNTWLKMDKFKNRLEGSDQRIQEDLMRFTIIIERFFLETINSIVIILFFIPVLFNLTNNLFVTEQLAVSTCLLLVVTIYTIIGMIISIKIAKPLVNLEYQTQKYEANFRYNLVHAQDGKFLALKDFTNLTHTIADNYLTMYRKQKYFNLWQKGYDQLSFLIPFIILTPSYFFGLVTMGSLMQIRAIFSRIRNAMAYLLDHYPEFTELLAISQRLAEFYDHIAAYPTSAKTLIYSTQVEVTYE